MFSSDGTVDQRFVYNAHGEAILAEDLIADERVERSYTACAELSSESLSGRVLCFTYDTLGRRIKTELPDGSDIAYVYRGGRLHEIRRGS